MNVTEKRKTSTQKYQMKEKHGFLPPLHHQRKAIKNIKNLKSFTYQWFYLFIYLLFILFYFYEKNPTSEKMNSLIQYQQLSWWTNRILRIETNNLSG